MPEDPCHKGYSARESFPNDAAAASFVIMSWDAFAENNCGGIVSRRAVECVVPFVPGAGRALVAARAKERSE
jgi:hypothetical protein